MGPRDLQPFGVRGVPARIELQRPPYHGCGSRCPLAPSKSIQPTIASATAISLSSPYFAQFASNCVPENRGVGGSIPPLTTIGSGLLDPSRSPFRVSGASCPQARCPKSDAREPQPCRRALPAPPPQGHAARTQRRDRVRPVLGDRRPSELAGVLLVTAQLNAADTRERTTDQRSTRNRATAVTYAR